MLITAAIARRQNPALSIMALHDAPGGAPASGGGMVNGGLARECPARLLRLARALAALAWASVAYGLASTVLHLAKATGRADWRLDRAWECLAVAWIHPPPQTRLESGFGVRAIPTFQLDGVTCARIMTMREHIKVL